MDEQDLRVDQEGVNIDANQVSKMAQVQKTIANQMWEDYNRSWKNYYECYFLRQIVLTIFIIYFLYEIWDAILALISIYLFLSIKNIIMLLKIIKPNTFSIFSFSKNRK